MIDTRGRGSIQSSMDKLVVTTKLSKLHPNTITAIAFVVGVISAFFLANGHSFIALVLLWISGLFDVLDGTVARITGKSSKLGAYLDLVFDRMVEAAIIMGFYFFLPHNALAYLLFFVSVLFNFTTFMVAGSLFKNEGKKSMHYDIGIVERTETFIAFSLMMLITDYAFMILMIFNTLTFITGVIRMYKIIRHEQKARKT